MFGVGLPEFAVLFVVAIVVFGPDRLPEFARQAGRFLRQVRQFTQAARDDLRNELGPEFADLELADLDPRQIVRKHVLEAMDEDEDPQDRKRSKNGVPSAELEATPPVRPGLRPLEQGERPPYDLDAT